MPVSIVLIATLAASGGYDASMAESYRFENDGRIEEAAQVLEPLVADYPQDYALHLRLGWLYFSAERYAQAETAYAKAVELSGGAAEARLGLAWTALRRGRRTEAADHFEAVLAHDASHTSALEGLALTRETPQRGLRLSLAGTAHLHDRHVELDRGGAGMITGELLLSGWLAGGAYRYTNVRGDGVGSGAHAAIDYIQHEGYAWVGLSRPSFDVVARYGLLLDTSDTFGTVHAAGGSARASPGQNWGDLLLEGNVTLYDDLTIVRIVPAWRAPLPGPFYVQPGAAIQLVDGEVPISGNLTLGIEGSAGALWLGGKYGREVRPTSLGLLEIYDLFEEVRFGAWAGGRLHVTEHFFVFGTWAMNALRSENEDQPQDSLHHLFSVGVGTW